MASDNSNPIPIISISRKNRTGTIGGGIVRGSTRPPSLTVRDLESSGGFGSTTRGCNTVFPVIESLVASFRNEGGPVASGAAIQLIFWGDAWNDPTVAKVRPSMITSQVQTLVDSSYFIGLKQYGVDPGPLGKSIIVNEPGPPLPPDQITSGDIHSLLWDLIGDIFPETDEDGGHNIYVVFLPPNAVLPDSSFDGAHNDTFHYVFPVKIHRAFYVWIGYAGNIVGMMTTFSHEVVETYTDPADNAWKMAANTADESEIVDVCNGLTGFVNGVEVCSYFSLADNACIIPGGQSVRQFLAFKHIDPEKGIRGQIPPGMCLRQFLGN